jgi:PAN domain
MKIMRMALTFGIGLAALASNDAFANQFNTITMEFGADRAGYDYKTVELTTNDPLACQVICIKDNVCRAYTFAPAGYASAAYGTGASPLCLLKNSDASLLTPKPGLISGRKLP